MRNDFRIFLIVGIGIYLSCARLIFAEPRKTGDFNTLQTFQDDGDSLRAFTVSVGTTTPVLVYFSTQTAMPRTNNYSSPDRILTIENIQNFNLFCSTLNTVSATTGNRFIIFSTGSSTSNSQFQTYSPPNNVYCIFESAAGAGTKEVLGWVGYDSGD